MQTNIRFATVMALATACISGFSVFLNKIAVDTVQDPVVFSAVKNSIVAVGLIAVILFANRWSEVKNLTRKQWGLLVAIGLVGGSVPFAMFFWGLTMTSAIGAAFVHKTLFLWVLIFGFTFLKERMSRMQLLGIGLLFAANAVMLGGFRGFDFSLGEFMILGATLLWAIENVIAKTALRGISSVVVASARMGFGALALFPFFLLRGGVGEVAQLSLEQWAWIVLVSAFLFAYVTTWYTALKYAPASYVAALLVPSLFITNALTAVFITHTVTATNALGALLFGLGTVFVVYFAKNFSWEDARKSIQRRAV